MSKHTPDFIKEMKTKLEEEKTRLEVDLSKISRKVGGGNEATFPDYGRNDEDNATEIGDYTATAATETAIEERLRNVEAALERIDNSTYGITTDGDLIPEERLRANPAATTIVKPNNQ